MQIINFTEARANLKDAMEMVINNHEPVAITRPKNETIVMVSLNEYNSWHETLYLLGTTNNAERLFESLKNVKKGKYKARKLIKPD